MLYLASGSPRRAELLRQIGVPFARLSPPGIDETPHPGELPDDYVMRMATEKAASGFAALRTDEKGNNDRQTAVVLGADTAVIHQGRILGKPADVAQAVNMLEQLAGTTHEVLTAVVVTRTTGSQQVLSKTDVAFRPLTRQGILDYVATGEPMDKAGAYGIQGFGALLVARITGSYSGVVGLPLTETADLLKKAGICFWQKDAIIDRYQS